MPPEAARSGTALEGAPAPAPGRPLQAVLFLLLTLSILVAVGVLATRSIWIDEAMLLRSVYEIGVLDFLQPLPYYDQASPFIPSIVLKLISGIAGTNFILFRWLLFAFIGLSAAPLVIKLTRACGPSVLLAFLLVCAASVYNLLFHATEIKHYGFEIAAVFLFLYWLLLYMENPEHSVNARVIWIPVLAIAMGFSTLLLVPAFFLFVIIDSMVRPTSGVSPGAVAKKHALIVIVMLATAGVMYAQMKHLTFFQMNNTWSGRAYGSQGPINDAAVFAHIIKEMYGTNFLIVFSGMSLVALFMHRNALAFRFTIFFVVIVIIVFALKMVDVYPVVSTRHVVWLIPINVAITAVLVHDLAVLNKQLSSILMVFLVFNSGTVIVQQQTGIFQGDTAEYQDNNALYEALEDLAPSDVLVFGHARPSYEIYRKARSGLAKHRYVGLMPGGDVSAIRMPPDAAFAAGRLREEEFTGWQFAQLPQTRAFVVMISHSMPIDHEHSSASLRALRATLIKHACAYRSLFTADRVQLLNVSCPQPAHGGKPARSQGKGNVLLAGGGAPAS